MQQRYHLLPFILLFFITALNAQTGCPGCTVNLPAGLPADTLFLQDLPDGEHGMYYSHDLSFRMPKTTTPVHAVDSTTPAGLPISKIEIISIGGLPPGLHWEPNQWVFETDTQTDGCVKFCGTPTQTDTFVMTVTVKATVLFFSQETSFPLVLYVAPKISTTEGFTMTNFTGCGSAEVSFSNNIPSGGLPGFTYTWDFGDGTTYNGENPPPHVYNTPGIYPVNYHAKVDTAAYILESVTILEVECVDQLGVGLPDLYFFVYGPGGVKLFDSSPHVDNTPLPYNFPVNLTLGMGNYTLAVWDEDSGLKGSDDECGTATFNLLSNGTLVAGGLTVVLNIVHDITEVNSTDTVYVYPQPAPPFIDAPEGLTACAGADSILLVSSSGAGNQWWVDGEAISGANDFIYEPAQSGYYQVQINTSYGCSDISDSVLVEIYALPVQPVYTNVNNSLRLNDTTSLPPTYALQWYNGSDAIPGATGFRYCATENGNYGLQVTDLATGCTNFYSASIIYDPAFDCTVGTNEYAMQALGLFPNPASGQVQITLPENIAGNARLNVWDAMGRLVSRDVVPAGIQQFQMDCTGWANGVYHLEISTEAVRAIGRLVIVR